MQTYVKYHTCDVMGCSDPYTEHLYVHNDFVNGYMISFI